MLFKVPCEKKQLPIEEPSTLFKKNCKFHQMQEFCISQGTVATFFSGMVDRFKNIYVEFLQDSIYQKLFKSVHFDRVATFWGHTVYIIQHINHSQTCLIGR